MVVAIIVIAATGLFVANKVKDVAKEFEDNPAMAAAELIVRASPDIELVSKDEENQKLTVRNKETGEIITVDVEDIREGKLRFETSEGVATLDVDGGGDGEKGSFKLTGPDGTTEIRAADGDELPDWVPVYSGDAQATDSYSSTGPQGSTGMVAWTTGDPAGKVVEFYQSELKERGYHVQTTTGISPSGEGGMVIATSGDGKRSIHVMVDTQEGRTTFSVTHNDSR
jgi:hypothetical protein